MFTSLPLPKGVDADDLLGGYLVALEGLLPSTLKIVVVHLVKGTWHEDVRYCPRPPELANMVRSEQRRLDAINRDRLPPPATVPHQFKDLRIVHRERSKELARQGYRLVAENITHEVFGSLAKSRGIPAGSMHLWAIDEIWTPVAVAHLVDARQIEAKKSREIHADQPITVDDVEYWSKIEELKDAHEVSEEQKIFRRKMITAVDAIRPDDEGREVA